MEIINKFLLTFLLMSVSLITPGCVQPSNIDIPLKQPPAPKIHKKPRVALVLGGGGARGYAHIGVLKVLAQAGVPIDLVVGSSAGSIIGALYADQGSASAVASEMMHAGFFDFADISLLQPLHAVITGNQLEKYLLKHMQARKFRDLRIPFVAVATDVGNGHAYVLSSGPIAPAVHASAAMPGAVREVHMYGKTLVDGSMVAPVPVNIAKRYHPDVIIAVNIDAELPHDAPTTSIGTFARAFDISLQTLSKYSGAGADVTIHPHLGNAGTFDVSHKKFLEAQGELAAREALPKIKAVLLAHGITLHAHKTMRVT